MILSISRQKSLLLCATACLALLAPAGLPASPIADMAMAATDSAAVNVGSAVAQTIYLPLRRPAEAEAYARAVQTPGPMFHKFLSRAEFVSRFAPTDADIALVKATLRRLGYTIGTVFDNHLAIQVTSTAGTAEETLGVRLKRLTQDGHTGMVPVGKVRLPAAIRNLVRGIGGLDTLHLARPMQVQSPLSGQSTMTPLATSATLTSGKAGYYLPKDFAARYGVNSLYDAGYKGSGQTIGIITLANFYTSDSYRFWKAAGLTVDQNRITTVSVDGGADIAPNWALGEAESNLDIQQAGALAPEAKIRVYLAPNQSNANFVDDFEAAASENVAETLSVSWGQAEALYFPEPALEVESSTYLLDALHDVFLEMAIQGQSMFAASGDAGAFSTASSCRIYGTPSADTPVCNAPYAPFAPASDPAITATGGTTVPVTLRLTNGTVLSVTQEQAWSWNYIYTQSSDQGHPISIESVYPTGAGGGVSSYFRKPYYQSGVSGITTTKADQTFTMDTGSGAVTLVRFPSRFAGRNVPDLSANADSQTGYQLVSEGQIYTYQGGTSFVAPQFNGVAALIGQRIGGRIGLLNPLLYGLGSTVSTDITAGDNWGYDGASGYDNATGLGVMNAEKLTDALVQLKAAFGR